MVVSKLHTYRRDCTLFIGTDSNGTFVPGRKVRSFLAPPSDLEQYFKHASRFPASLQNLIDYLSHSAFSYKRGFDYYYFT